jgi:hypothetical protein
MCSHDTALRDIAALVEGGVLVRNAEGGLIAARIQGSIDQYSPPEIISLLALNLRRTTLAWTVPALLGNEVEVTLEFFNRLRIEFKYAFATPTDTVHDFCPLQRSQVFGDRLSGKLGALR